MSSKATKLALSLVLLAGFVAASIAANQEAPPEESPPQKASPQERIQVQVFDEPFVPEIRYPTLPYGFWYVAECLGRHDYVGRVSYAQADNRVLMTARRDMVDELVNSKLEELKLKPHQDRDKYRDILDRAIGQRLRSNLFALEDNWCTGRFLIFGATPEAVEELARRFIASYHKQAALARESARVELTAKQERLPKLQQEFDTAEKKYQGACRSLANCSPMPKRLGDDLVAKQMMMEVESQGLEERIGAAKKLLAEGNKSPSAQARIEEILFEDQIKLAGLLGEREGLARALMAYRRHMKDYMGILDTQKAAEQAVNELKYEKGSTESRIKDLKLKLQVGFAPLKLTEPIQIRPVSKPPRGAFVPGGAGGSGPKPRGPVPPR